MNADIFVDSNVELEKAAITYEPQLKRLARNVLRGKYTDGVIDDLLTPETNIGLSESST